MHGHANDRALQPDQLPHNHSNLKLVSLPPVASKLQLRKRIEEGGIPAWLDFLDAARLAMAEHNGRGAVLESHAALDAFLTDHQARRLRTKVSPTPRPNG